MSFSSSSFSLKRPREEKEIKETRKKKQEKEKEEEEEEEDFASLLEEAQNALTLDRVEDLFSAITSSSYQKSQKQFIFILVFDILKHHDHALKTVKTLTEKFLVEQYNQEDDIFYDKDDNNFIEFFLQFITDSTNKTKYGVYSNDLILYLKDLISTEIKRMISMQDNMQYLYNARKKQNVFVSSLQTFFERTRSKPFSQLHDLYFLFDCFYTEKDFVEMDQCLYFQQEYHALTIIKSWFTSVLNVLNITREEEIENFLSFWYILTTRFYSTIEKRRIFLEYLQNVQAKELETAIKEDPEKSNVLLILYFENRQTDSFKQLVEMYPDVLEKNKDKILKMSMDLHIPIPTPTPVSSSSSSFLKEIEFLDEWLIQVYWNKATRKIEPMKKKLKQISGHGAHHASQEELLKVEIDSYFVSFGTLESALSKNINDFMLAGMYSGFQDDLEEYLLLLTKENAGLAGAKKDEILDKFIYHAFANTALLLLNILNYESFPKFLKSYEDRKYEININYMFDLTPIVLLINFQTIKLITFDDLLSKSYSEILQKVKKMTFLTTKSLGGREDPKFTSFFDFFRGKDFKSSYALIGEFNRFYPFLENPEKFDFSIKQDMITTAKLGFIVWGKNDFLYNFQVSFISDFETLPDYFSYSGILDFSHPRLFSWKRDYYEKNKFLGSYKNIFFYLKYNTCQDLLNHIYIDETSGRTDSARVGTSFSGFFTNIVSCLESGAIYFMDFCHSRFKDQESFKHFFYRTRNLTAATITAAAAATKTELPKFSLFLKPKPLDEFMLTTTPMTTMTSPLSFEELKDESILKSASFLVHSRYKMLDLLTEYQVKQFIETSNVLALVDFSKKAIVNQTTQNAVFNCHLVRFAVIKDNLKMLEYLVTRFYKNLSFFKEKEKNLLSFAKSKKMIETLINTYNMKVILPKYNESNDCMQKVCIRYGGEKQVENNRCYPIISILNYAGDMSLFEKIFAANQDELARDPNQVLSLLFFIIRNDNTFTVEDAKLSFLTRNKNLLISEMLIKHFSDMNVLQLFIFLSIAKNYFSLADFFYNEYKRVGGDAGGKSEAEKYSVKDIRDNTFTNLFELLISRFTVEESIKPAIELFEKLLTRFQLESPLSYRPSSNLPTIFTEVLANSNKILEKEKIYELYILVLQTCPRGLNSDFIKILKNFASRNIPDDLLDKALSILTKVPNKPYFEKILVLIIKMFYSTSKERAIYIGKIFKEMTRKTITSQVELDGNRKIPLLRYLMIESKDIEDFEELVDEIIWPVIDTDSLKKSPNSLFYYAEFKNVKKNSFERFQYCIEKFNLEINQSSLSFLYANVFSVISETTMDRFLKKYGLDSITFDIPLLIKIFSFASPAQIAGNVSDYLKMLKLKNKLTLSDNLVADYSFFETIFENNWLGSDTSFVDFMKSSNIAFDPAQINEISKKILFKLLGSFAGKEYTALNFGIVKYLVDEMNIQVDNKVLDSWTGDTILHLAVRSDFQDIELFSWLIKDKGIDKEIKNARGKTAYEMDAGHANVRKFIKNFNY